MVSPPISSSTQSLLFAPADSERSKIEPEVNKTSDTWMLTKVHRAVPPELSSLVQHSYVPLYLRNKALLC